MSPEDDNLVRFLRQHRVSPPAPSANLEDEILQAIEVEARSPGKRPISPSVTIVTAIAAIALLLFGSYRWFHPTPKVANLSDQELEAFVADNWNETLGESNRPGAVSPQETTLTEPQLTYSVYSH